MERGGIITEKALFIKAENKDFGDIVKIARAEACKILGVNKIKVLNIIYCPYPKGYVAVVQNSGCKGKNRKRREN